MNTKDLVGWAVAGLVIAGIAIVYGAELMTADPDTNYLIPH